MKLGARIVKTGIAIILALLIARLLELPSPVFAGIAAIFAVQPTIYRSYLTVIEQVQGNLIGAIIAVVFGLTLGNNLFIIGLAAILVILINLKLKLENTISLSLVTLIAILEATGDNFTEFALLRFSAIIIGVLAAFIVNLVFLPPRYENKLYQTNVYLNEELSKWLRISTTHVVEHRILKEDIEKFRDRIHRLEELYLMYKEERNYYSKKKNFAAKSRKLVIYRQMIIANKTALDTLRRLYRYEYEIQQMPEHIKDGIQEQLDRVINLHEQAMLKYIKKIKPETPPIDGQDQFEKKGLFNLFLTHQKSFTESDHHLLYHMMQLVSVIMEYEEQAEHLDTLITSFHSYHHNDKQLTIEGHFED